MLLKEVCVENLTNIHDLISKGVKRIELCDNLAEGGTSVSPGVAKKAVELGKKHGFEVMAMVRPRGGNFVYSDEEIQMMLCDIEYLKSIDCDGVVFGCLSEDCRLDIENMEKLIKASSGMKIVFHMAFDKLLCSEKYNAIDYLAGKNVDRILTHGGYGSIPILENLSQIKEYNDYANGRIIILAGGGVNEENAMIVAEKTGVREVHGTRLLS